MIPQDIPPVCRIPGCTHGAQIYAKIGDNISYLQTCRRHHLDLLAQKDKKKPNK